jgi:hypothetical protein
MVLMGKNSTRNAEGQKVTTLHVADAFNSYYDNAEAGRTCVGQKVESVYVGTYDCTGLKVGMEIEILYDKAVQSKTGFFQPIKRIDILSK